MSNKNDTATQLDLSNYSGAEIVAGIRHKDLAIAKALTRLVVKEKKCMNVNQVQEYLNDLGLYANPKTVWRWANE